MIKQLKTVGILIILILNSIQISLANKPQQYTEMWKEYDAFISKGSNRDALGLAQKIYDQALKDNKTEQQFKALIHIYKNKMIVEENSEAAIVNELKKSIQEAKSSDRRALLEVLLAHSYFTYYTSHQYKILERTYSQELSGDFTMWDARQFQEQISKLYRSALKEKDALGKYTLKDYSAITLSESKDAYKVPFTSLADLLYYESVRFFSSERINLNNAVNQFEIDKPEYFATANEFIALQLKSDGQLSGSLSALQLLQEWMKVHNNDKNSELSAFIDYYRLNFVYGKYAGEKKTELYAQSLEKAYNTYASKEGKSLFKAELIKLWNENRNNPFDYTPVQIVAEAQKVVQQYSGTYGAQQMTNLISNLQARALDIQLEEAVAPGLPFKVLVEYRNISTAKFRIFQWNKSDSRNRYYRNDEIWKDVQKQKVIRTGSFRLPASGDLMSHSIEMAMSALPAGEYALVVYTEDTEKDVQNGKFTVSPFYVSQLSVLLRERGDNIIILVKDRITGQPVDQAQVEVVKRKNYDAKDPVLLSAFSNAKGEILLPKKTLGQYTTFSVKVKKGKDLYQIQDQYFYNNRTNITAAPSWNTQIQFFTDRAIYRPGQQVFFKGIAIDSKEDSVRASAGKTIQVRFLNANSQEVNAQTFITNEFGSISGFFKIPEGGLNGQFVIYTDFGSTAVSVEDYKRPTFEVKTLPVAGSFQLNDTVSVKGQAVAYSGANISQAKVSYIVQRKAYYPFWRSLRMIWPPFPSQSAVLVSGTTETDADGRFVIDFIAEPDRNKNDIYEYEISVDVQDITGEVRSTSTTIRVGKNGVQPNVQVEQVWEPKKAPVLKLSSKNLQDNPVKSAFQISIHALNPSKNPKKDRYWMIPDQFSMTEAEHDKLFPYDIYKDEPSAASWKAGAAVWNRTIEVNGDSALNILPDNLPEGMYRITSVVVDKNDTIRLESIFEVKKKMSPSIAPDFLKLSFNQNTYKAGDKIEIAFDSDLKDAYIYAYVTQKDNVLKDTLIYLQGQGAVWTLPVTESMKGNVILHYEMVAQNRDHSGSQTIEIPLEQLNTLTYKWTSFRNKLLPGSKEAWTLQILDKEQKLADAELLATLYDASLDEFVVHDYFFNVSKNKDYWYAQFGNSSVSFRSAETRSYAGNQFYPKSAGSYIQYPQLNFFGWSLSSYWNDIRIMKSSAQMRAEKSEEVVMYDKEMAAAPSLAQGAGDASGNGVVVEKDYTPAAQNITLRSNFNETAFFYPQMRKDAAGNYVFNFTIPDALTTWKFLAIAHTTDLRHVVMKEQVVTQKDLMVQLNKPRFARIGDELFLNARISNLTDESLDVTANIVFRDAQTNEDITSKILKTEQKLKIQVAPRGNSRAEWLIKVPAEYEGIIFEVTASAGDKVDGESDVFPVLENRILLTESTPIFIQKKGKYDFNIKDFIRQSGTAQTKSITFEYTSQPVWQALMALPYLNEQKDVSATSLFNRFYAHSLASYILKTIPESKTLLEAWKKEGSLKSALEKNQELKSVVLEATPWLKDAQNETEQMQQLFVLLTEAEKSSGRQELIQKLKQLQTPSGGISWYPDMSANRYITQNIALGFYQLQHLGVLKIAEDKDVSDWLQKALVYLEREVSKEYDELRKRDTNYVNNDHLSYTDIQYLFLISHINDKKLTNAEKFYYQQAQKYALQKSNYAKAAIALALNRTNDKKTAQTILNSFKQSAVYSEKEGMYWKAENSYFWYYAPIETQALIIQAFDEIAQDEASVNQLKVWLLRQKQTNSWKQPKATAEACYALLLTGGDWKATSSDVITYDKKVVEPKDFTFGTGYIKTSWEVDNKVSAPGTIRIQKKSNTPSWGAVYHQYWEDLDKVQSASDDLQVRRTLYKVVNTATGEELTPITKDNVQVGDKIRIKLELKINKDVEFFHLQDTRASGFEPVNVLSGYKYQGGLGYYEVNGDAATHWYMDFVRKGNYVFEYTVFVNVAGSYSSGVTSGECLYAPEFRFQSNGSFLNVVN